MNLYLIDKHENVVGLIPDSKIISLSQSLEINKSDILNGSICLDKSLNLDNIRYFAVPDRDNSHNLWMYRKTVVKIQNDSIDIQGVSAFYDDLKGYGYIKDKRPNAINASQAIGFVLGQTRWNVDFVDTTLTSSGAEIHDINFYYLTYLDSLKAIEEKWQVEIQPFINIEGNKITRKYVELYQQMGGNKGKRFVYGKSALQIVKESNDTDVYTALIGRGSGIEEQDSEGNNTGGYSRKINFANVVWSKSKGDPVDKPLGQEWIEWPAATAEYGYSDGTPRFGIVDFENEKDESNLLKETWESLKRSAIPAVQFSATVGDVGFLNLGETVAIVRYDLDIKYQTRVIKIEWNRKNESESHITLGDKLVQTAADRYRSVQSDAYKARDVANEAQGQANFAIINGGNNIEWGINQPVKPKEGDIWYDKKLDGTVVMKQFKDGQWIILIDDTTGEQIKNKLDKAEKDVQILQNQTTNALDYADKANNNAEEAIKKAEKSSSDSKLAVDISVDLKKVLENKVSTDNFTTYKQQTDKLISTKVDSKDYQSQIIQIDQAIQSKVDSKDFNSKVTQLSNSITTEVTNTLSYLDINNPNLLQGTRNFGDWFKNNINVSLEPVTEFGSKNLKIEHLWGDWSGYSTRFEPDLKVGEKYTVSAWVFGLKAGIIGVYYYEPFAGGAYRITDRVDNKWTRIAATFTARKPDYTYGNRRGIEVFGDWENVGGSIYVCGIKLEKGEHATEWSLSPDELTTKSQITQLNNDINLRVKTNDVLNQINISTEGILIDGNKVHITGNTVIDNAAIKSANIADLSASKLTAGVIDCRKIDVMNIAGYQIMANQITADKLSANTALIGLNNDMDSLQLFKDGMTLKNGGNLSMTLNRTGIHVSDFDNGEQIGWIHTNHFNEAHWFNGLVFDLEEQGDYIGFGIHNASTNLFDLKFAYYKNAYGNIPANSFSMDADVFVDGWVTLKGIRTPQQDWLTVNKYVINGNPCVGLNTPWGAQCGIEISGNNIYVKTASGTYDLDAVIHSIGRNTTWN